MNAASVMEFDEVIDPRKTRKWVSTALESIPQLISNELGRRYIDSW